MTWASKYKNCVPSLTHHYRQFLSPGIPKPKPLSRVGDSSNRNSVVSTDSLSDDDLVLVDMKVIIVIGMDFIHSMVYILNGCSFDVTKCHKQIEMPDLLQMCAQGKEQPSNINTMRLIQMFILRVIYEN